MVEYFLKTRDGMVISKTRTSSPDKIATEAMWYQNRGYDVIVVMEREVPLGQLHLVDNGDR